MLLNTNLQIVSSRCYTLANSLRGSFPLTVIFYKISKCFTKREAKLLPWYLGDNRTYMHRSLPLVPETDLLKPL